MKIQDLAQLVKLTQAAGQAILAIRRSDLDVAFKAPGDPVTRADQAANQLICGSLQQAYPGVCIVAEESAPESFAHYRSSAQCFFVDPLDGTREFLAENGEFGVMVGFTEGNVATAGAVWSPTQRRGWAGGPGLGAFEFAEDGSRRSVRTTAVTQLNEATLLTSRFSSSRRKQRAVRSLGVSRVIERGSAALKGVAVAEGEVDLYISPGRAGKKWDACAIDAIVRGAGGTFTDMHGHPLDYRGSLENRTGLLATNGLLQSALLERLIPLLSAPATPRDA